MATTTPNYGWDVPTSTDYVKDGATAIETLGDDIDATLYTALGGAYPGLRLIKKQTVGSAVASVTVTGAFSATYDNYLIVYSGGVGNGNYISFRPGTIATANYYFSGITASFSTAAVTNAGQSAATSFSNVTYMTATGGSVRIDVLNPFLSDETHMMSNGIEATASTSGSSYQRSGFLNTTASYTSFDFVTSGTITGGTIYVYGYGQS